MDASSKVFIDLYYRQMNKEALENISTQLKKLNTTVGGKNFQKMATSAKNMNTSMKDMKGSMVKTLSITLPLMFAFQNISKTMKSVLDPAMELAGVNETYQQFLALKYLPTALEQLDAVMALGDEWGNQSEEEQLAAGDAALLMNQIAELGTTATNTAMTFGAMGSALGGPVGQAVGTLVGGAAGLAAGLVTLSSQTGTTITNVGGMGQAMAIAASDSIPGLLNALDNMGIHLGSTTTSFNTTTSQISADGTIGGKTFMNNLVTELNNTTNLDAALKNILAKFTLAIGTTLPTPNMSTATAATLASKLTEAGYSGVSTPEGIKIVSGPEAPTPQTFGTVTNPFTQQSYSVAEAEKAFNNVGFPYRTFAAGGIVTRPTTALIGESGPEAVIPLDRIGSIGGIYVTINTSTIGGNTDALAREISDKLSFELSRVRY